MPTELLLLLIGFTCLVSLAVLLSVRRFDPRLARCVEPTDTGYRVRLNGWDQSAYVLLVGGVFLTLAGVLGFAGASLRETPWKLAAATIPVITTLWATRSEPFTRFLIDDEENGTLSWPEGSVRREEVTGVEVISEGGQFVVRLLGLEPKTLTQFRHPADGGALVGWLYERLNVSPVVPSAES